MSEDVQKLRQEAIDLYWETCTGNAMAEARVDALIAAVRAERDAAWREGVEAVRGTMPGINKRPDEVSNDAFYETRGMENALAALAARMEAK